MPGNTNLKAEASKLTAAERRPKVVRLRQQGLTTRQIAGHFGVSHTTIENDLKTAYETFAERESEETQQLRALESLRLDKLQTGVWVNAVQGDLRSVHAALLISARRCALFGLNQPANVRAIVDDQLEAFMRRLEERLDEETLKRVLAALFD